MNGVNYRDPFKLWNFAPVSIRIPKQAVSATNAETLNTCSSKRRHPLHSIHNLEIVITIDPRSLDKNGRPISVTKFTPLSRNSAIIVGLSVRL